MPVWQKAFTLLLKIYEVTKTYPTEERLSDILNVDYHHLVFTIPWQLRSITLANAKVMLYIKRKLRKT